MGADKDRLSRLEPGRRSTTGLRLALTADRRYLPAVGIERSMRLRGTS